MPRRKVAMDCNELKTSVLQWFGAELDCRVVGPDSLLATFPILKPNGDPIEVAIERAGTHWKLSDLGDTHSTLYLAGVELSDESQRTAEFRQILQAHRIDDSAEELLIEASPTDLIDRIFDFVQAIQSLLALQVTLKPKRERRDFASIVAKFLAENRASFEIPPANVQGKTGRWHFNFVLNHTRAETLVQTLSVTSTSAALQLAKQSVFEIRDVREIREANALVITDDEDHRARYWQPNIVEIFRGYDVTVRPFVAERDALIELAHKYSSQ